MARDDVHNHTATPTVAGKELDDFLVDPNFQGAFVGGPPLMSLEEARRIIEHPDDVQREALDRLEQFWKETGEEEEGNPAEREVVNVG